VAEQPLDVPTPSLDEVRRWLGEQLPAHMVPERVVLLPTLPLSANGKTDRRAICDVLARHSELHVDDFEPPAGELESRIARIWGQILGSERIGRDQSFFALGGDSLSATRLVETLRQRLSIDLSLRRLFTAPTVAGLSALIAEQLAAVAAETFEDGVL
jgi:yersiniabactin nonribosomal peptide synthetase